MKVAIIGGGIIGLASAAELSRVGCEVTIYDINKESKEASWAAAGMLAPHNEAKSDDALWHLCQQSYQYWPTFLERFNLCKNEIDYRSKGCLTPYFKHENIEELMNKKTLLNKEKEVVVKLTKKECLAIEPLISDNIEGCFYMEGAQVNPRHVCTLLRDFCLKSGVQFKMGVEVQKVKEGSLILNEVNSEHYDQVVIAAGAWTPQLSRLVDKKIKGEPVKGQMLCFEVPENFQLNSFIHSEHAYCVHRKDQGLVIGSTMEMTGFDKAENELSIEKLRDGAREVLPILNDCHVKETWTGLRPKLENGYPCIDRLNEFTVIATGHFRNGILLTPVTALAVKQLVLRENLDVNLNDFSLASH